jgi:hypothetical protein
MAKFSYVDGWGKIVCENDDLEKFWQEFIQTSNFYYDIVSIMWECCANYHLDNIQCSTSRYLYPFVKTYMEKMSEIDTDYLEGIEEFEKIDNITIDIITKICENDKHCRDLIIKDFSDFKVDD